MIVLGAIALLLGTGFALQGAYILEATFMRGPAWIAIGTAIALVGAVLVFFGLRRKRPTVPE